MNKSNPARRTSITWWILLVVFLFLCTLPFIIDIGYAGYALLIVSAIMVIMSIIIAIMYGRRARKLDKIFKGEGLLAHWTYKQEEWQLYAQKQYNTERRTKWLLLGSIAGIALVVGVGYLIADVKSGIWVFVAMVCLIIILAFVAWFTSWYNRRQNFRNPGEVYIAGNGVYIAGQLHLWNQIDAYLRKVEFIDDQPDIIGFDYIAPTLTLVDRREVYVPVPSGHEAEAKKLVEQLNLMRKKKHPLFLDKLD